MGIANHVKSAACLFYACLLGIGLMILVVGGSFIVFWRSVPSPLAGKIVGGIGFVLFFCTPYMHAGIDRKNYWGSTRKSGWKLFFCSVACASLFSLAMMLPSTEVFSDLMIRYPEASPTADVIIVKDSDGHTIDTENRTLKFWFFGGLLFFAFCGYAYCVGKAFAIVSEANAWLSTLAMLGLVGLAFLCLWHAGHPLIGTAILSQAVHGASWFWLVEDL